MPVFANFDLGKDVAAMLEERCAARGVLLDAWCLMPDHSCTTRVWWRHGGQGAMWQRSFYDRGLRTMRDYDEALAYVLANLVRAGLVEDWADFPLLGGRAVEEE